MSTRMPKSRSPDSSEQCGAPNSANATCADAPTARFSREHTSASAGASTGSWGTNDSLAPLAKPSAMISRMNGCRKDRQVVTRNLALWAENEANIGPLQSTWMNLDATMREVDAKNGSALSEQNHIAGKTELPEEDRVTSRELFEHFPAVARTHTASLMEATISRSSAKLLAERIRAVRSGSVLCYTFERMKLFPETHAWLVRVVRRSDEEMEKRLLRMGHMYMQRLTAYREIHGPFFSFAIERNVLGGRSDDNGLFLGVLTHLVNYSTTVTLAQFHHYVFQNTFSPSEVCEFFLRACREDELFSVRARYILHRYQKLGDGNILSITNGLCITEMFLFPLLARRIVVATDREEDASKLDTFDGSAYRADKFYASVFERPDLLRMMSEYAATGTIERGSTSELTDAILRYLADEREMFVLANMMHWRYDGCNFVDPATDSVVSVRSEKQFVDTLASKICNATGDTVRRIGRNEDRGNRDEDRGSRGSLRSDETASEFDSPSDSRKPKKTKETAQAGLRRALTHVVEDMANRCKLAKYQHSAESAIPSGSGNHPGQGESTSYDSGRTLTKFVRYTSSASSGKLYLNLSINRFELGTPVVAKTLRVDYDDVGPPAEYCFRETRDRNVESYVRRALELVPEFFRVAGSRDCVNHYLHSDIVPKRDPSTGMGRHDDDDDDGVRADDVRAESGERTMFEKCADQLIGTEYKTRLVCQVSDLLNMFPGVLDASDARAVIDSHIDARRFALAAVNLAHRFGRNVLRNADATYVLANAITDGRSDPRRLLYAPMACRAHVSDGEYCRINYDVYESSKYLGTRNVARKRTFGTSADESAANTPNAKKAKRYTSSLEKLLQDLQSYDAAKLDLSALPLANGVYKRGDRTRSESVAHFIDSALRLSTNVRADERCVSPECLREFLSDASLDEFLETSAAVTSMDFIEGLSGSECVTIAAVYMFILTRERERSKRFGDQTIRTAARCNVFARLERDHVECINSARRVFPEMYIQSLGTDALANGLDAYVSKTLRPTRHPSHSIGPMVCAAVVSLYVMANGNMETLFFLLRFITAIRYPGQFLKSVLLIQGSSDSGKSEFVHEVLRSLFSCQVTGSISNATLRHGMRDEVNTDIQSMMNSHLCQCDEPERLNAELVKQLVSEAPIKTRRFFSQNAQVLTNLAKMIFTSNDLINLRSDAGVITRFKYVLRTYHRFRDVFPPTHNTSKDFTETHAAPSISYQIGSNCCARGVNFGFVRVGLFMILEHFAVDMSTYNESRYVAADMLSANLERCRALGSETTNRQDTFEFWRKCYFYGLMGEASLAMSKDGGESLGSSEDRFLHAPFLRTAESVDPPVVISQLSRVMREDADNLHITIDPYQWLRRRYNIIHDVSVPMTEQSIATFLRDFLDEVGYSASRAATQDVVAKMRERIKTDFPRVYDSRENVYRVSFRPIRP